MLFVIPLCVSSFVTIVVTPTIAVVVIDIGTYSVDGNKKHDQLNGYLLLGGLITVI